MAKQYLLEEVPVDEWEKGKGGREETESERQDSNIAWDYGYDSVLEMGISYFDSDENKEKKREIYEKMTESDRQEYEAERKAFQENAANSFRPECLTEEEIMEMKPDPFDGKELYEHKRSAFRSMFPEMAREILPVENVRFPTISEHNSKKQYGKDKAMNQAKNNLAKMMQNVVTKKGVNFRMGQFWYEDGELKYSDDKKGTEIVIGNFWIEIRREIIHMHEICNELNIIHDYMKETTWKICIYCMDQIYEAEKTKQDLLTESQILKITNDRGYLESGGDCKNLYKKYVHQLIAKNNFAKEVLFDGVGWTCIPDMGWQYLIREGVIGDKACNIKADVPYHFIYNPEMVGSEKMFQEFFELRKLCKTKRGAENATFLMHFSGLSVMTTLFQNVGKGVNFIVALTGPTNSQKTSVGKIFSRMFDRTNNAVSDIRFNSTEVAIMEKMAMYGDSILMVDDIVPYSAKKQREEQLKKFETVIRSYGDREPRKRSKIYAKINGVPEYSPVRGCCLVTGEIFQTESESSDTRVIQLPFEPGDVDLKRLTHHQNNLLDFPTFLYDYICDIRENIPRLHEIIDENFEKIRSTEHFEIRTPRFIDTLAIMSSEVHYFYEYAVRRGYLSADEANKYLEEDLEKIIEVIRRNDQESKTKSPATLICLALNWALQTKTVHLCSREMMKECQQFERIVGEDNDYYYVLPETLWQIYKEYNKNSSRELIFKSDRELSAPLRKENVLFTKAEGKDEKLRSTHKIGSFTTKRFFFMKKKQVNRLLEIYKNY